MSLVDNKAGKVLIKVLFKINSKDKIIKKKCVNDLGLQTKQFNSVKKRKKILSRLSREYDLENVEEISDVKEFDMLKNDTVKNYSGEKKDISALESYGFKVKRNVVTNKIEKDEVFNKFPVVKNKEKVSNRIEMIEKDEKGDIMIRNNIEIGHPRVIPKESEIGHPRIIPKSNFIKGKNTKDDIIENLKGVYEDE
jgi:hypothetical protein